MQKIIKKIFQSFEQIEVEKKYKLSHIPEGIKPFLLAYLLKKLDKILIYVVENNQKAEILEKNLTDLGFKASSFPYYDILPYESEGVSQNILKKRIKTFYDMILQEKEVVIVPVKSLLYAVNTKNQFLSEVLSLKKTQIIKRKELIDSLVSMGYQRMPHVEFPGDFSVRGELIDIFPIQDEHPLRIDFFDEEIERIRYFYLENQLSIPESEKEQVVILPLYDFVANQDQIENLPQKLKKDYPPDMIREYQKSVKENPRDFSLIPFCLPNHDFFDFLDECKIEFKIIWNDLNDLGGVEKAFLREIKDMFYSSFNINKIKALPNEYIMSFDSFEKYFKDQYHFSSLDEETNSYFLSNHFHQPTSYRGRMELFTEHQKQWKDYEITIGCFYEGQEKRIHQIFPDLKTTLSKSLVSGFIDHLGKYAFILEQELFGKKYLTGKKRNLFLSSSPIEHFSDLERGDAVVHVQHGIGSYQGIEKISVLGKTKDYIKINYADDETLYVPIEQIFLVHKYLGSPKKVVRLDKLGGKNWQKKKQRVYEKMEEMAAELALLYEKRKQLSGFQFISSENMKTLQNAFEAGFPYEETEDQQKAIEDVKTDMEGTLPMDRLVCGDVGYGKTEVAMRAAFRAVASGKQVAMLIPTTILAEQHFQTFLERFENFPVTIAMLSRLVPRAKEKIVKAQLEEGVIDILIGTHKILGNQVKFKELGLLIIDEEQRFGVRHKEKIKQLKSSIDVLTLTATPIPRTLYMGLSSLRDMSLITTPPISRMPVKTFVMPFSDGVMKMAIQRELDRGGQVYIVHNRVKTIESFTDFIRALAPNAKIVIGHAQLPPAQVEEIFLDFIHGEYDILISTTIIENGIDIPNANTILIDKPELLGLSELYQLRGRVGRSDRQAYCYLFYDAKRGLTDDVKRRLEVIEEHTELGSGFKIAMKDLEIRGAGNLLGKDQSGVISDVGIELYSKIMAEAVKKVKGSIGEEEIEPLIDIVFNGYIPDDYIQEEKERFSIYKVIMRAKDTHEATQLSEQVKDRYGKIPEPVENLIKMSFIKVLCKKLGIRELKEKDQYYTLDFIHQRNVDTKAIAHTIQSGRGKIFAGKLFGIKRESFSHDHVLDGMRSFLESILKN